MCASFILRSLKPLLTEFTTAWMSMRKGVVELAKTTLANDEQAELEDNGQAA